MKNSREVVELYSFQRCFPWSSSFNWVINQFQSTRSFIPVKMESGTMNGLSMDHPAMKKAWSATPAGTKDELLRPEQILKARKLKVMSWCSIFQQKKQSKFVPNHTDRRSLFENSILGNSFRRPRLKTLAFPLHTNLFLAHDQEVSPEMFYIDGNGKEPRGINAEWESWTFLASQIFYSSSGSVISIDSWNGGIFL